MDVQFHNWHIVPPAAERMGRLRLPALLHYLRAALLAYEILSAGNAGTRSLRGGSPRIEGLPLQSQIGHSPVGSTSN